MAFEISESSGMDAMAQAELVRRRELTPLELVDAAIARIERVNPVLNAGDHTVIWTRRVRLPSHTISQTDRFVECRFSSRTSAPCGRANRTTWAIEPHEDNYDEKDRSGNYETNDGSVRVCSISARRRRI